MNTLPGTPNVYSSLSKNGNPFRRIIWSEVYFNSVKNKHEKQTATTTIKKW